MGVLDKYIYELLPYTKTIDVKDELVIYDHADGKTKRVRVESLVTDNDFDFPWDSEMVYAKNKVVSFGGDLWESRESGNLGNMPVEGQWWTKLNKVVGSTVVEYRPGAYGKGLVIVHYPYAGSIAAYAGVKLWELVVPEGDRPFNSTNIIAEIEAVDGLGDPAPKWVPVHPVGGGTDPGDLTAFVAKNKAGTDVVLTPSEPSRWGNILSEGKSTLIAFLDYIGSRLGQIGDKDVDPASRADGRFLKYDVLAGKYVHAEVEAGEGGEETPESIKVKYESNEDRNAFTDARRDKLAGVATGATKNANTDELDEGSENKYFTEARAVGSKLAGYVKAETVEALSSAKTVLEAISILEKALDGKVTLTPGGMLVIAAEKERWNDTYTKSETDNKIAEKLNNLVWKDAVAEVADLVTAYPDAIEGWAAIVNSENAIYRFNGTSWGNLGNFIIPKATASVDGLMSKEGFVKLRDVEAGATKNTNTDELDEGSNNFYFTDARSVSAKVAGYVRAEVSGSIKETDSVLQALGKLDKEFDNKLSIRGDNFIATRPGADPVKNGTNLLAIYNEAKLLTPGGNPLSVTNRIVIMVFPGIYHTLPIRLSNYIDIVGFGDKESIIFDSPTEGGVIFIADQYVTDIKLNNFTLNKEFICSSQDTVNWRIASIVFKGSSQINGTPFETGAPQGTFSGSYEDIVCEGTFIFSPFEDITGTFTNIKALDSEPFNAQKFRGRIEGANLGREVDYEDSYIKDCKFLMKNFGAKFINCEIISCEFEWLPGQGPLTTNAPLNLGEGNSIRYSKMIGKPGGGEKGRAISSITNSEVSAEMYHCIAIGEIYKVINIIPNGHNSWEEESTGEGLTPEQEAKLVNTPLDTNQELQDLNTDMLAVMQDLTDAENAIERLQKEYVLDLDFETAKDFVFKAPEAMVINSITAQTGTTATVTGYTVSDPLLKHAKFTISVDVPGMVTLKGVLS